MRLTLLLLCLLAAPLSAQSVDTPPVGYWSLTSSAFDAEGRPLEVAVIVHFRPDSTFIAVLKTNDRSGDIGSSAPFVGRWSAQAVFGQPMICVRRMDMAGGVCQYTVRGGGLYYVNRPLVAHTEEQVRRIAPEITGAWPNPPASFGQ